MATESREIAEFATSTEETARADPNKHRFLSHGRGVERTKAVAKLRDDLQVTAGSLFREQDQRVRTTAFDMGPGASKVTDLAPLQKSLIGFAITFKVQRRVPWPRQHTRNLIYKSQY